jgi:hypothetical protein
MEEEEEETEEEEEEEEDVNVHRYYEQIVTALPIAQHVVERPAAAGQRFAHARRPRRQ